MIHVVVSVLSRFFLNIFLRWRFYEFNRFLLFTARPIRQIHTWTLWIATITLRDSCRRHLVTVAILSFNLLNFIIVFSWGPLGYLCCHYFWTYMTNICHITKNFFWIHFYLLLSQNSSEWTVWRYASTSTTRTSMDINSRLHFIRNLFSNAYYSLLTRRNERWWRNSRLTSLIL